MNNRLKKQSIVITVLAFLTISILPIQAQTNSMISPDLGVNQVDDISDPIIQNNIGYSNEAVVDHKQEISAIDITKTHRFSNMGYITLSDFTDSAVDSYQITVKTAWVLHELTGEIGYDLIIRNSDTTLFSENYKFNASNSGSELRNFFWGTFIREQIFLELNITFNNEVIIQASSQRTAVTYKNDNLAIRSFAYLRNLDQDLHYDTVEILFLIDYQNLNNTNITIPFSIQDIDYLVDTINVTGTGSMRYSMEYTFMVARSNFWIDHRIKVNGTFFDSYSEYIGSPVKPLTGFLDMKTDVSITTDNFCQANLNYTIDLSFSNYVAANYKYASYFIKDVSGTSTGGPPVPNPILNLHDIGNPQNLTLNFTESKLVDQTGFYQLVILFETWDLNGLKLHSILETHDFDVYKGCSSPIRTVQVKVDTYDFDGDFKADSSKFVFDIKFYNILDANTNITLDIRQNDPGQLLDNSHTIITYQNIGDIYGNGTFRLEYIFHAEYTERYYPLYIYSDNLGVITKKIPTIDGVYLYRDKLNSPPIISIENNIVFEYTANQSIAIPLIISDDDGSFIELRLDGLLFKNTTFSTSFSNPSGLPHLSTGSYELNITAYDKKDHGVNKIINLLVEDTVDPTITLFTDIMLDYEINSQLDLSWEIFDENNYTTALFIKQPNSETLVPIKVASTSGSLLVNHSLIFNSTGEYEVKITVVVSPDQSVEKVTLINIIDSTPRPRPTTNTTTTPTTSTSTSISTSISTNTSSSTTTTTPSKTSNSPINILYFSIGLFVVTLIHKTKRNFKKWNSINRLSGRIL